MVSEFYATKNAEELKKVTKSDQVLEGSEE